MVLAIVCLMILMLILFTVFVLIFLSVKSSFLVLVWTFSHFPHLKYGNGVAQKGVNVNFFPARSFCGNRVSFEGLKECLYLSAKVWRQAGER
jgi:hypothetical protein